jgi:nucleoid DNA-binding protein
MEFEGLIGIDEYLLNLGKHAPINTKDISHISDAIQAYTGLTKEISQDILNMFFQEIRSAILRGEIVDIRKFGTFLVSSPKTSSNNRKVFIKFKPKKSIVNKLNEK